MRNGAGGRLLVVMEVAWVGRTPNREPVPLLKKMVMSH